MIVKPTVNELLDHAENRFALVIAASKRAREIANGDEVLTEVKEEAPVTLAANEINEGKIKNVNEYLENCNVELAKNAKALTYKVLDKVLFLASLEMKNGFSRGDA